MIALPSPRDRSNERDRGALFPRGHAPNGGVCGCRKFRRVLGGDKQCVGAGRSHQPKSFDGIHYRSQQFWDLEVTSCRDPGKSSGRSVGRTLESGRSQQAMFRTDWTKADIRLPSLQEATLDVARFVSCMASLGRDAQCSTSPKRRETRIASELASRCSVVVCSEDLEHAVLMQRRRESPRRERGVLMHVASFGATHVLLRDVVCNNMWRPPTARMPFDVVPTSTRKATLGCHNFVKDEAPCGGRSVWPQSVCPRTARAPRTAGAACWLHTVRRRETRCSQFERGSKNTSVFSSASGSLRELRFFQVDGAGGFSYQPITIVRAAFFDFQNFGPRCNERCEET